MSNNIDLKKGLDIPIKGSAKPVVSKTVVPDTVAIAPSDFKGLLPRLLVKEGVQLINITTMMPRYEPYGRGMMIEHDAEGEIRPFHGVDCLLRATREIKQAVPEGVFMCTGLSWLDVFGANVAAGGKEQGWFDIAGFGRQAFAYPGFANDILTRGKLDSKKVCMSCDCCYDFIQHYCNSGCAIRDPFYSARYREQILPLKKKA